MEPPPRGWCKLNVDGMRTYEGIAGFGDVIKGDEGEWLRGFSCKLENYDALAAEV